MVETELTPKAREILDILRTQDRWLSRSDIASFMEKKQLNPHEFSMLEVLINEGLIAGEKQPIPGNISTRWMYRYVKED